MNPKNLILIVVACSLQTVAIAQTVEKAIYISDAYRIFNNRVEQGNFESTAISPIEMSSNYRSPDADKYSPTISFTINHSISYMCLKKLI